MSDHDPFAASLAAAQDALLQGDPSLVTVRERLLAPVPRSRPGRWIVGVSIPVLALAAAALFWATPVHVEAIGVSANGQSYATGDWISAVASPVPVAFTDGSEVTLQSGAQARIQGLREHGVDLSLERGRARFEVQHADQTDWRIHAGPFEVQVRGTVFQADWQPDTEVFSIEMSDGRVFVTGPHLGEGREVEGAETLQVWLTEHRSALTVGSVPQPTPVGVEVPVDVPVQVVRAAPPPATPQPARVRVTPLPVADEPPVAVDWQTLVQRGAYADAVALVEQSGVDLALSEGSASDLIALGDAARLSKQYRLSEAAYLAVRDRFPGGVAAANGAFSLGRLAFDQRKQMDTAARWLRVYVAEQPDGVLVREAMGRLMEADSQRGERAAARSVADDYLARFPDGPHAAYARGLVKRRRP